MSLWEGISLIHDVLHAATSYISPMTFYYEHVTESLINCCLFANLTVLTRAKEVKKIFESSANICYGVVPWTR